MVGFMLKFWAESIVVLRFMLCFHLFLALLQPSAKETRQVPDYLIELYYKLRTGSGNIEDEERHSNKIVTIYPKDGTVNCKKQYLDQGSKLVFNVSNFDEKEKILGVDMRFFLAQLKDMSSPNDETNRIAITITTSCRTKISNSLGQKLKYTRPWNHIRKVRVSDTGKWIRIKVKSAEKTLAKLRDYRFLYHFQLECVIRVRTEEFIYPNFPNRTPILLHHGNATWEPALTVFIADNLTSPFEKLYDQQSNEGQEDVDASLRSARSNIHDRCRREDFYINFEKLKIHTRFPYPTEINIRRCVGKCNYPLGHLKGSSHAAMQSFFHSTLVRQEHSKLDKLAKQEYMPCCVPKKLQVASLFYSENDNLILKTYDDLIAESCHCL